MADRTVDEIYDVVLEVKEKVIVNIGHIIDLKEHVNDEVQLLRESYDTLSAHRAQDRLDLFEAIRGKQNSSDLLRSVIFQALNNKAVRWALGASVVSAFATVVSSHWIPWLERIAQFFRLV
jgi:hypothetical protein